MQRTQAFLVGLMIVAAAWLLCKANRPACGPPKPLVESVSSSPRIGGIGQGKLDRFLQAEPELAGVPRDGTSNEDSLVTRVVARLREWEDEDDSELRPRRIQELDGLLDGTNMLDVVQELPPDLVGFAFALPSLRARLMSDPRAALDWMSAHTNISDTQLLTLLHDWAHMDREQMRQNLVGLPESEWKQTVMAAASEEVLSSDPVDAFGWAAQVNPGQRQTVLLEMATTEWAKRDPVSAALWVNQVNDPVMREQLAGSLAIGYADSDPIESAEWVMESVGPGELLDRSLAEIVWAWALENPAAAGAWVGQFPEGQVRHLALGNLVSVWENRDRAGLAAWVEGLQDGTLRTEAADLLSKTR